MKKLFISMAIVCTYTYPAAWDANLDTLQFDEGPTEPTIIRSSGMTLYDQILTKFTKDLFFKELEQIRKQNPRLTDPKDLIRLAYAKVEEQSKINSDDLIAPYYFGLSIQDLIDHNLIPNLMTNPMGWATLYLTDMYINDLNGLQDIPGIKTTIWRLFLDNNRLKDIPLNAFAGLTNLETLSLDNNQIQTIHANTFDTLKRLNELYISNNRLQTIEPNTFASLNNLSILFLKNNQLQAIAPHDFATLRKLQQLELDGNQLQSVISTLLPT